MLQTFLIYLSLMRQLNDSRWTQVENLYKEAKKYTALQSLIHDHLSHLALCFNWLRPLSVLHGPRGTNSYVVLSSSYLLVLTPGF